MSVAASRDPCPPFPSTWGSRPSVDGGRRLEAESNTRRGCPEFRLRRGDDFPMAVAGVMAARSHLLAGLHGSLPAREQGLGGLDRDRRVAAIGVGADRFGEGLVERGAADKHNVIV